MRILVVHDWEPDPLQALTWKDGLAAAIRELSRRHVVNFITFTREQPFTLPHEYFPINFINPGEHAVQVATSFEPDVVLHWADTTREHAEPLSKLGIPMALCFAGGATDNITTQFFDHFFVESLEYLDRFGAGGYSVSQAFGTNTDLFKPTGQPKLFDVGFPATYCNWKRHDLFTEATKGLRAWCAGFKYGDHEQWCYEVPEKAGVLTLPHVGPEALQTLYNASRCVFIPSLPSGGSQRTVLEAMACNVPVVIVERSKGAEYVLEGGGHVVDPDDVEGIRQVLAEVVAGHGVDTRGYIMSKWSHLRYADELEMGLKTLL